MQRFNPPGLHRPDGYAHITVSSASRMIHFAGQCPLDVDDKIVGDDFLTQTDQVIANCLAVLDAAGVKPDAVVRSVVYVVSTDSGELADVWHRLMRSPLAPAFTSASTLLGVAALGYRGQLIEVDLTAETA
ncbi:RidA family protein [Actinoplanes sp. NPDC049265]|uniref:RidA family protein n=1 Tax=Actinoplanes sp. NPDC049265 TaxID=3363902 RepID=UPI003720ACC4